MEIITLTTTSELLKKKLDERAKKIAQQKVREFLSKFSGLELGNFVDIKTLPGASEQFQKIFKIKYCPISSIDIGSKKEEIERWVKSAYQKINFSKTIFIALSDFGYADFIQINNANIEDLWQVWKSSKDKSIYIFEPVKNILFIFFEQEYDYEFRCVSC